MEQDKKYKGDFKPKYMNVQEIEQDPALLPGDKVRELVKHYSMCLFGLATDMASAEKVLKDKEIIFEQLKIHNTELRAKIKELENYADPQVKRDLPLLRKKITMLENRLKEKSNSEKNLKMQLRLLELKNEELKEMLLNG